MIVDFRLLIENLTAPMPLTFNQQSKVINQQFLLCH